jgi:hypothetical protein
MGRRFLPIDREWIIRVLNDGDTEAICVVFSSSFHANIDLKILLMMLECLERLIDVPKPDDLFWTKSLEFGIRTVATQHEQVGLKRDCEIQAFQNLLVKCISSPFESIQAAVLTAIAFDFHDCLIGNRLLILSEALSQHPRLSRYWNQARNEVIKRFDVENAAGNDAQVHLKTNPPSVNDSPPER